LPNETILNLATVKPSLVAYAYCRPLDQVH